MEKFIEKLSSYNFLNNLLPGAVFCYFFSFITGYNFNENAVLNICIYYFCGMLVSRIGSLVIEPLFKKLKIVKFADYESYLTASENDEKINSLVECNNMYRTFLAAFITLAIVNLVVFFKEKWEGFSNYAYIVIGIFLIVILIIAYRKQTSYIRKRVEHKCNEN